ncbi:putative bifunctional diguanylate cyclase/phosphodiesterase [Novosphingobium sp. 9]|uniref:putative bifunctional diguanylate cyclase/phosphodiesterase n=1 Tax=Novosphingobium sp. 9 TaxID=2025349 RepID=UPI0021B5EAE9|nr:EAL domain-containing protein [Novosphingobium sp. 9]
MSVLATAFAWLTPAQAGIVRLRQDVCYATAPLDMQVNAVTVSTLRYDCSKVPAHDSYANGWVWLKLRDPQALRAMPQNWQLLLDQTRHSRLTVMTVLDSGETTSETILPGQTGSRWMLGGTMRIAMAHPGHNISALYVGYQRLDDLSLMRKISAASPASALRLNGLWLCLMGMFIGAILSAFAYNLLIYLGQRAAFQRWYLVWCICALGYGLIWTNMAAYVLPDLVGPLAVRMDYLFVSALIACGNMFFLTVIEAGILPRGLIRAGRWLALINFALGALTAIGVAPNALTMDRWLNIVFVASAVCLGAGVVIAIRRRSRVVWFYLIGWTPVLAVFILRVARNFGIALQDDTIDMGTFVALGFECVALSLAIADRFRLLGRERDRAEHERHTAEVERESYRRAAQTDFLTGLGNRAAFHAELRALGETANGAPFTLMLIDVDHLKEANDRLGHDGGDMLLENVARGLISAAGNGALVARTGGDEFAILVPGARACADLVEQALEALQGTALVHNGRAWTLSLSIGRACCPTDGTDGELLVKNADLALYAAKQHGRRRLVGYQPELRAALDQRLSFGQEAAQGIARGEFSLHLQPIIDMASGLITSHEALLRWQHPVHGMMTPATFGEMLDDRTVGVEVQKHVIDLAMAAMRDHPERIGRLCVNLNAAQLDGPHAANRLLARLRENGIAPQRLCVEVTEQVVLDQAMSQTVEALKVLHAAGVHLALDDFGTGYASLIHLKTLPFDVLKIDRSFTFGLFEDDGQSEAIVRAIIGLGKALNKPVVAEGIETEAQRARLSEMGCEYGQGYLFARPMPIAEIMPAACAA